MRTLIERVSDWRRSLRRACESRAGLLLGALLISVVGCEPSLRELENRRELEALLTAVSLKNYLDSIQTPGVEELKMDIDLTNPEITLSVDRQRAMIEGINSSQIGMELRTALFGLESSKIKEGKDEYKIYIRNQESQRKSISDLLNMNITYRDIAAGGAIRAHW